MNFFDPPKKNFFDPPKTGKAGKRTTKLQLVLYKKPLKLIRKANKEFFWSPKRNFFDPFKKNFFDPQKELFWSVFRRHAAPVE